MSGKIIDLEYYKYFEKSVHKKSYLIRSFMAFKSHEPVMAIKTS
jgi:hypothetical protein